MSTEYQSPLEQPEDPFAKTPSPQPEPDYSQQSQPPTDQPEAPEAPGVQPGQEDNENYPGRSPNHTYYIDPSPKFQEQINPLDDTNKLSTPAKSIVEAVQQGVAKTRLNKLYPKPDEGSSGTGKFPPETSKTMTKTSKTEPTTTTP